MQTFWGKIRKKNQYNKNNKGLVSSRVIQSNWRNLKELRESKNMSRKELAQKLNKDVTTIFNYESGKRRPDLKTIVEIANIFDISIEQAVGIFLPKELS
jgi:transcriptional regulator with XRE-family HTH domain